MAEQIKPWSVRLEGKKSEILAKIDGADMPENMKAAAKAMISNHSAETPSSSRKVRIPKASAPKTVEEVGQCVEMVKFMDPEKRADMTKDAIITNSGKFVLECSGDPDHHVASVLSLEPSLVGSEPIVSV